MYWADQDHSSVMSANKFSGRQLLPLATGINHVTSLVIDQPVLYPSGQGSLHQGKCWCLSFKIDNADYTGSAKFSKIGFNHSAKDGHNFDILQ